MITHGAFCVIDILISIKQTIDELTILSDPPSDIDLLIYTTHGLGPTYKELITTMRTQDFVVPFEQLFDKAINHENFLLHNKKPNFKSTSPIMNLVKQSPFSYHPPNSFSPVLCAQSTSKSYFCQ